MRAAQQQRDDDADRCGYDHRRHDVSERRQTEAVICDSLLPSTCQQPNKQTSRKKRKRDHKRNRCCQLQAKDGYDCRCRRVDRQEQQQRKAECSYRSHGAITDPCSEA